MKIKEKFHDNHDGTFVIEKEYDNTPCLDRTAMLRSMGAGKLPESWCVASIPNHLIAQWMKEENIDWEDSEGRKRMLIRKVNDPDFKNFRIVGGRV